MTYAVGPRAVDAWRILTAIAEARVPEYEAKREMSWMGREDDLLVVLNQIQEFSMRLDPSPYSHPPPAPHPETPEFNPYLWRRAIAFTTGGYMREFFDDSMHLPDFDDLMGVLNFQTGVELFKSAAREVFRGNNLLSTRDMWETFSRAAMQTLTQDFMHIYL